MLDQLGSAQDVVNSAKAGIDDFYNHFVAVSKNSSNTFKTTMQEIRAEALVPISVPGPVFAPLPKPIYTPDWGLNPPVVPPVRIPPIPSPVYQPNWGLTPPPIPALAFPALPSPVYEPVWGIAPSLLPELSTAKAYVTDFATAFQAQFAQAAAQIPVYVTTAAQGMRQGAENAVQGLTTARDAFLDWGNHVITISYQTASGFVQNVQSMAQGAYTATANFINAQVNALVSWGNNVLQIAAQAAKGFASNFVSGLSSAWASFKSFMGATGQAVGGFFQEHAGTIAVVATIAIAGIAIAGAMPSGGASLGALALIPALADGAVIPPNKQFLALLGDQTHGTNIETPLATMVQAFNAALDGRGGSGGEITIRIVADGAVARAMKFEIDKQTSLSGVKLARGGAVR